MNSLILKRLLKYSWIIISVTIISLIGSFSLLNSIKYEANITLGLSFNNPKLMETGIDPVNVETPNFIEKQGKLSRFLVNKVMYEEVYRSIINQWNDSKIENFQITGIQKPVQSVQVKTVTLQEKLIAPISVFILSILLTITWPEPKNNKK